jgi:hypothetical protein
MFARSPRRAPRGRPALQAHGADVRERVEPTLEEYPQFPGFAEIIDSHMERPAELIRRFRQEDMPRIAISEKGSPEAGLPGSGPKRASQELGAAAGAGQEGAAPVSAALRAYAAADPSAPPGRFRSDAR